MPWFEVSDSDAIPSPALLLFEDRLDLNLAEMVRIAGDPVRLRPHLKTHKLPELLRRQMDLGIRRFKASTIAETAMAAQAGAPDILLACQPVGPALRQLLELAALFPNARLSCVADDEGVLEAASKEAIRARRTLPVLLDLDVGQHRTGIPAGDAAAALYARLASLPGLEPGGLHVYDGHLGDSDPAVRAARCNDAFAPVAALRKRMESEGFPVPTVVAGGSPTFPIHALRGGVELSPGTTVLWDAGYARKLPDLAFLPAAVLLCRVLSRPGTNRLCLDLGHKAVASEMPPPRVEFLNLPEARAVSHSEEHLVVETPDAGAWSPGRVVYALPWHVCPTVALHEAVYPVRNGRVAGRWRVAGRTRFADALA